MAHKIKKTDLLIEIRGKGAICRTYQEENPDKLAQQRVSKLDNNPCGDGKYYVNVLLKDGLSLSYTDPETIKKLGGVTNHSFLSEYDELKNLNACIIELDVQSEKCKVQKFSELHELMKTLYNKSEESGILISKFSPVKRLFSSNPFCEDIELASLMNYKKIIYSIGNFSENDAGKQLVMKEIDSVNNASKNNTSSSSSSTGSQNLSSTKISGQVVSTVSGQIANQTGLSNVSGIQANSGENTNNLGGAAGGSIGSTAGAAAGTAVAGPIGGMIGSQIGNQIGSQVGSLASEQASNALKNQSSIDLNQVQSGNDSVTGTISTVSGAYNNISNISGSVLGSISGNATKSVSGVSTPKTSLNNSSGSSSSGSEPKEVLYSYNLVNLTSIKEKFFKDVPDGLESKINNFVPEIKSYTFYDERKQIEEGKRVAGDMKIYDFVEYFEKVKSEILSSKALQIRNSNSSINLTKNFTAFNLFKKIIGNEGDMLFDNSENMFLSKMENQFNTFKQLFNKNDEFTKSVKSNDKYLKNMLTFEKVDLILKSVELKYLQESYEQSNISAMNMINLIKESIEKILSFNVFDFKKSEKLTKNQNASNNLDDSKYHEKLKSKAEDFIKNYLVFFKNYAPTLDAGNNIKFTNNLNKTIEIIIPCFFKASDISLFDFISTNNFISTDDEVYSTISLKFTVKNEEIQIKNLDVINMNSYSYIYYKELSDADKKTMTNIINEIDGEKLTDTKDVLIHKHNQTTYYGFKLSDVLKRFSCVRVEYSSHKTPWTNPEKQRFFNVPIAFNKDKKPIFFCNDRELADKKLKETQELFKVAADIANDISMENHNMYLKGQLQKIYIDTLSYDPWQDLMDKMDQLCIDINQTATTDENDYIKFKGQPDIEETPNGPAKDPIKLCDKTFPMDLFGVTGLLGLDDLLAKFGLKSDIKSHIYDSKGACNYNQIAKALSSGCNGKAIEKIQFTDIESSGLYKTEKSILSQFKKDDLDKFKKEYAEKSKDTKTKAKELEKLFEKNVKVGIADGYYFYPAGVYIDFEYTLAENMIKLKGTLLPQSLALFNLVKLYGTKEYEPQVKAQYKTIFPLASSLNALPLNVKIFLGYPFKPDLVAILGGEPENVEVQSESGEETVFYIPEPDSIKSFIKTFPTGKPATIRFNVFYKSPIVCEYPKCKGKEGKCGLEELLEKPVKLDNMVSFDIEKRLVEITAKAKRSALAKEDKSFKENIKLIGDSAWNIGKNLFQATVAVDEGLNTLYSLGTTFAPIMDLLPLKCLVDAANDGRNAICSASREARDKTAIEENDFSFMHTITTVGIVASDACEAVGNHVKESFKSFSNAGSAIYQGAENLINTASIYNLCQRRFGDYLADSGIAKGLQDGLNAVMETNISDIMKGILGSCFTNGIIDTVTESLDGLDASNKAEVKRLLEFGDTNSINELGKKYPQMIEKFGDGKGGMDLQSIYNKSGFDMNLLTNLQAEFVKRMNPMSMTGSAVQSLASPNNLIQFAKSGVGSLVKGEPAAVGTSLLNNIKGNGLNAITNQVGTDISTLFNTNPTATPNAVSNNVMDGMHAYILEKRELMKDFA